MFFQKKWKCAPFQTSSLLLLIIHWRWLYRIGEYYRHGEAAPIKTLSIHIYYYRIPNGAFSIFLRSRALSFIYSLLNSRIMREQHSIITCTSLITWNANYEKINAGNIPTPNLIAITFIIVEWKPQNISRRLNIPKKWFYEAYNICK